MSVAKSGADDRNCGLTNKDLIHRAICRLVASGVTVVAAAGNNSFSAAKLKPASYNEVITVSALADTDGKPGGTGGQLCYSWGTYDRDDTFADFSNYGGDVDLIAPGKCIWSTLPGNRYGYISGTSMAAPHVTGAAALFKASRPVATPGPGQGRAACRRHAGLEHRHGPGLDPRAAARRVAHRRARRLDAGRQPGQLDAARWSAAPAASCRRRSACTARRMRPAPCRSPWRPRRR